MPRRAGRLPCKHSEISRMKVQIFLMFTFRKLPLDIMRYEDERENSNNIAVSFGPMRALYLGIWPMTGISAYCLSWRGARNPSDLSQIREAGLSSVKLCLNKLTTILKTLESKWLPGYCDAQKAWILSAAIMRQGWTIENHCKSKSIHYFCFSHTSLSVVQALAGPAILKVCDPYGYIQEPPLCNKYWSTQSHWFLKWLLVAFQRKKTISECKIFWEGKASKHLIKMNVSQ